MTISFDQIPNTQRVPFAYIEFNNSKAVVGPTLKLFSGLLIGQKLAGGTAVANTPILVTQSSNTKTLFGAGSMLVGMVARWFQNNPGGKLTVIPVADDGAGVAATAVLTFTGPATAAGTLAFYHAGKVYNVAVAAADTAITVAAALTAAINADTDAIFTAVQPANPNDHKVNLTYKHKGLIGNELDLQFNYNDESMPVGLACAITAYANGATNPVLTAAISAMGDVQYDVIGFPYTDAASLLAIETELASRWGPLRQNDGRAFAASNKDFNGLSTLGNSRNSPHVVIMAAYKEPMPTYEKAAALAAVAGNYLSIDPARPLQTLPLLGMLPPKQSQRFLSSERNLLLFAGIATSIVDAGGTVCIERAITTYKTNALGAVDPSYLDVETLAILSYIRYDFRNYIMLKYPRHKLADDGTRFGVGQVVMTPALGRAEALSKFTQWETSGLVEGYEQFKAALIVERNAADRSRLDWYLAPDLINQLRINGMQIGFLL